MYRPRVIPVLLLKNNVLVKTVKFSKPNYIGDPINAVRLFNELKADELVFLDIQASKNNNSISLDLVKKIGEESNMPFSVGGGIKSLDQIRDIIAAGAERVIISSQALKNPTFIKNAAEIFGSSSIIVCIDVKKNFFGKLKVYFKNGSHATNFSPIEFAQLMESFGVGELIIQSIDRDGTMAGYDIKLIKSISEIVKIPVTALGGAGNAMDLHKVWKEGNANGLAAGSLFVYQGSKKGVLINYPEKNDWLTP
jgi:cyclase